MYFDRNATQSAARRRGSGGMHRRSNAAWVLPQAVKAGGEGLRLDYGPGLRGPLTHWSHETFRVAWDAAWRGEALITFQLDLAGRPVALSLGETRFRRVADAP